MKINNISQKSNKNLSLNLDRTKPAFSSSSWKNQEDDEFVKIPKKKYKFYKFLVEFCTAWVALDILAAIWKLLTTSSTPPKL